MTLRELFDLHRDKYVTQFIDFMNQTEDGNFEILLKYEKNRNEVDIYNYYRPDCLKISDESNKIIDFGIDTYLNHKTVMFDFHDLELFIQPVIWNNVEIEVERLPHNMEVFYKWIEKWVDIEDELIKKNEQGLQEVIHSVSQFINEDNNIVFSIDFGSAPIDSLFYLFDILYKDGLTKAAVYSSNLY